MGSRPVNVSALFIRRPIGTILLAIGVFLIGAVSYFRLPVASLPSIDFPAVFIITQYPGASPETVAAPIERHVGEIPGVTELTSVSSLGSTVIISLFDLGRNVDGAARDVQAALNAAALDLPSGLPNVPTFRKANPNNAPILILALTSELMPSSAVYDAADSVLLQRISQVEGVAQADVAGADQPAIRIRADPARLSAMGLSLDDIRTTIVNANAVSPTGAVDGQVFGRAISTSDQLRTLDDYRNLVLKNATGSTALLSDVATISNSTRNDRSMASFNGKPAVLIYVRKQANANVIQTVDHIKTLLPELQRFLPAGIDISVLNDRTVTIRASISDMILTLGATIILVMGVVFVFLRRLTPTAAAGVTVPLALAGTCACMYAAHFSIDNISLMALATSVGFVVDDAIVMIENIDKHRDEGLSPLRAALVGSKEIGFTVISISVSLMAAFLPLLLLGGAAGLLFREFSVTLAFAILISTVASLTITPMISANFTSAKPPRPPNRFDRIVEGALARVVAFYAHTLRVVLRHRVLTICTMFATIALTVFMFKVVPKGFFPEDETDLIQVSTEASPTISYRAIVPLQARVAALALADPAVQNVGSSIGSSGSGPNQQSANQGRIFISLKPPGSRGREPVRKVMERLKRTFRGVAGIDTFLIAMQDLRFGGRDAKGAQQFTVSDSNLGELNEGYPKVLAALKALPMLTGVTTDHEAGGLQVNVNVDRLAASRLGVTMANVDNTLNNSFAQRQVSTIYSPRNQYRVVLESPTALIREPNDILDTFVPAGVSLQSSTGLGGGGVETSLGNSTNNGQTTQTSTASSMPSATAASSSSTTTPSVTGRTAGAVSSSSANAQSSTQSATPTGQVQLAAMAKIGIGFAPLSVNHQGQFPEVTISFDYKPGVPQATANEAITKAVTDLHLPDTLHAEFTGDTKLFQASAGSQALLLYAALISVYIVLGVLYESLAHPITIISTLPSAGLGALLALKATGTELSLIAFIGIVLLIGIVKKNGIMLVDFALHAERVRGLPPAEAIYDACIERFRPILMTTLAALLGAVPLILASGPGSALRRPLGITIAGGLLVSQVLTLYTTPVIYLYLDKLHGFFRRLGQRGMRPRRAGRERPAPAE